MEKNNDFNAVGGGSSSSGFPFCITSQVFNFCSNSFKIPGISDVNNNAVSIKYLKH